MLKIQVRDDGPGLFERGLFLSIHGGSDLLGDVAGYVPLQRQRIAKIGLVTLGPYVLIGRRPDQLGGNPNAVTGP